MKVFTVIWSLFIGISLVSCQDNSELSKEFSCSNSSFSDLEVVEEFQKEFSVQLPKNWKTELYNISNQSGIISADTTKLYKNTYTIDFSIATGNLDFQNELEAKVEKLTNSDNLVTQKKSFHIFNKKEAFAHLSKGNNKDNPFYIFQYYIKIDEEKYLLIKVEIFGDDNVEERLCSAISLINMIKF